ncbi:MerR family transcriptional regulator [Amycolatopsis magusensis]|uniref:MerR family transcriptional regulator n=1 Tax=Amycolatopsis magusensis TaxID=882444 RepID=UPI0037A73251
MHLNEDGRLYDEHAGRDQPAGRNRDRPQGLGTVFGLQIGDAAAFAGSTPRAIRHYHEIGLLPEPERGGGDRRRYGYEDMIRLLWIRRMADAGIALDDIRDAFTTGMASAGADSGDGIAGILERLEETLAEQEAESRRQWTAVQRMRTEGSRMGLLSDFVTDRLKGLPEGSLRQADLDTLLVTERIFGPLGAAVQATRFVVLATHPTLREESDRIDDAEEALDDSVAVDDPRVARVAAELWQAGGRLHERVRSHRQDALRLLAGPPALYGTGRRTVRPGLTRSLKQA